MNVVCKGLPCLSIALCFLLQAKHKETVIRSPSPTPRPSKAAEGEPLQSSSQIDLGKPEAVGMLPLQQQMEYLELKKRLVLHAKRQREEAIAEKGEVLLIEW